VSSLSGVVTLKLRIRQESRRLHDDTPHGVALGAVRAVLSLRPLCVCSSDTSSIHSKFFHRHKNTEGNTRRFISKCFLLRQVNGFT